MVRVHHRLLRSKDREQAIDVIEKGKSFFALLELIQLFFVHTGEPERSLEVHFSSLKIRCHTLEDLFVHVATSNEAHSEPEFEILAV